MHPTAKPQNSASAVTAVAGTQLAVVATCESVDGRPPAKISWVTTANGNATTESKAGVDNTVTVISKYSMVPKSTDNGKDISCVVDHRTLVKPESFKLKLAIQCKIPLCPLIQHTHARTHARTHRHACTHNLLSEIPLACML